METNGSTVSSAVRAVAFLARRFDRVLADECDLSMPQYRMLAFLSNGEHAATRLAEHLAVSKPSVTALVAGLVDRGLVERRHGVEDRRTVLHGLTPAGHEALAAADTVLGASLTELTSCCDDGPRVVAGLDHLAHSLRSARERTTA